MNIKQAKEQIRNAAQSYFTTDGNGAFLIPVERQRPVFMIGPPGIGKTAVMEQIAAELGVGLVSYSMTHHTRQSALGLPFIVRKNYGGREYSVSEYTMSEIIASVWERIENDGAKKGILFLDEINCVSETLAPSMLQFLQYKTFGTHRVPDGWIVVTAGNPPEYNNSVREFDIVTWDRLKRIDVEPDFEVWKEYALEKGVHPAVITYLDIRKEDFYCVETTAQGKQFVTARGWVDLSDMIKLYEQKGFRIDGELIAQYIQNPRIARDFSTYYDLFIKYKSDYQVDRILGGTADDMIIERAAAAKFDERISLLGLVFDAVCSEVRKVADAENSLTALMNNIKSLRASAEFVSSPAQTVKARAAALYDECDRAKRSGALSAESIRSLTDTAKTLGSMAVQIENENAADGTAAFTIIKKEFDSLTANLKSLAAKTKEKIDNSLLFCEKAFGAEKEIALLITELTAQKACAKFIGRYGCEQYFRLNKELLITERHNEITQEILELNLD
ncbi:MAG: AAA family ATPase [Clostridia bacterium]|nr:AAA family ATPase [Clostridia bacterium]